MKKINKLKVYAGMLALAASTLVGCTTNKKNTVDKEPTKIVTEVTVTPTNTVTPVPTIKPVPIIKNETITETIPYHEISNMGTLDHAQYDKIISLSKDDVKYFNDTKRPYNLQEFDMICNENTFAYFMDKIDFNYTTYYDVYLAIAKNPNVDSKIKSILVKGVKNLEKNAVSYEPTLDTYPLTPLAHNLSELKVLYFNDRSGDWTVLFNPYQKQLTINTAVVKTEEELEEAIIQGAIGYGLITTYAEVDGKKILCSPSEYCFCNGTDLSKPKKIVKVGQVFEDAMAEIITHIAMDKPIRLDNSKSYEDIILFNMYLRLANIKPTYYDQCGYKGLVQHLPGLSRLMAEIDTVDDSVYGGENANRIHACDLINMCADSLNYQMIQNPDIIGDLSQVDFMKRELRKLCNTFDSYINVEDDRSDDDKLTLNYLYDYIEEYVDKYFEDKNALLKK